VRTRLNRLAATWARRLPGRQQKAVTIASETAFIETMHRAFSTLGCAEFTLDGVLGLAAEYEIDAVELRALGGTLELPTYFASTLGEPAALDARVARRAAIASLDTSFSLIGNTEQDRDKLLDYVPWAEAAGVPFLRIFDGGRSGDESEIAAARATFAWWREMRARHGWLIDLMVETHDAFAHQPALVRLLDAEPSCLILWDAHHTWRKGGAHPVETWRMLGGRVPHIHVKDSVTDPQARLGYRYVLPGTGEFPMAELRDALERDGYSRVISLEWERLWHPDLPPLTEALQEARSRNWW
jgi:sugar phosphate isomerase/epimerase